jgi:hypothetical protein
MEKEAVTLLMPFLSQTEIVLWRIIFVWQWKPLALI